LIQCSIEQPLKMILKRERLIMKHKHLCIIILICLPLILSAKHVLYERYDEDIENLFNILINYDRHGEVFEFVWENANIGGPHVNVFTKIIKEEITSYKIIDKHYLNGFGMYYIFVTTEKDPYGEYFWIQCCEDGMNFVY